MGRTVTGIAVGNLMIGVISFLNALLKNKGKKYRDDDGEMNLGSVMEQFGKPCFIASESNGEIRGSARSFGDFSVFGALSYAAEALDKFGGHPGAGERLFIE